MMDSVLIRTIGFLGDFQAMYILLCIFPTVLKSKQTTKSNKKIKKPHHTSHKLGMSFLSFVIGICTLWEMHSF